MPSPSSSTIKSPILYRFGGWCIGWLIRVFTLLVRFDFVDQSGISQRGKISTPVIYACWHNRIVLMPSAWRRLCGWRKAAVLTSASKDGAFLTSAVGVFGISAIRGSSAKKGRKSKRGGAALVAMRRAIIKDDCDICITPDGPRGPRYSIQPGIIKLAQATGAAIQPLHMNFSRALTLNTWDGARIPLPFSKVTITAAPLITVAQNDESEMAKTSDHLRSVLLEYVEPSSIATETPDSTTQSK